PGERHTGVRAGDPRGPLLCLIVGQLNAFWREDAGSLSLCRSADAHRRGVRCGFVVDTGESRSALGIRCPTQRVVRLDAQGREVEALVLGAIPEHGVCATLGAPYSKGPLLL